MSISSAAVGHFSHTLKYYWPSILFWMDSWPGWLTCWLCSHGRRSFPCLDSTRPKLTAFQRHQRITREQPRSPEKARDNAQRQHTNRRQPESYKNKKKIKRKGGTKSRRNVPLRVYTRYRLVVKGWASADDPLN